MIVIFFTIISIIIQILIEHVKIFFENIEFCILFLNDNFNLFFIVFFYPSKIVLEIEKLHFTFYICYIDFSEECVIT